MVRESDPKVVRKNGSLLRLGFFCEKIRNASAEEETSISESGVQYVTAKKKKIQTPNVNRSREIR